ncbi:MAG: hypothetical protein ABSG02_09875 [Terriglobales bacterium]|jgi:hypothetical protein
MTKDLRQKSAQAAAYLFCAIMVWNYGSGLAGTEFSGGRITGPLLDLYDIGSLLFIMAVLLTFFLRRIAAGASIVASLLCLPLYLYFVAPGPFRRVVGGTYSVPLRSDFVWDKWASLEILVLAIAATVGVRGFLVSKETKAQNSG